MNAWWNLVRKEIKMVRTSLLVQLAGLFIGGFWLVYLPQRYHPGILWVAAMLLAVYALFYPAMFMLTNVYRELTRTVHLWLHCPQPAWMLLSAKLSTSLAYIIFLLLVAALFVYWGLFSGFFPEGINMTTTDMALFVTEAGIYAALFVIAMSVYLTSWATLMAVATVAARNILGRLQFLAGVSVFVAATWGMSKLQETWVYQKLTHWGAIKIHLLSIQTHVLPDNVSVGFGILYAGEMMFYSILIVALFALSAWFIDHKVEV